MFKNFPEPHHTVAVRDVSSISESDSFLLILRVKVQSTLQASKVRFQFKNALPTYFFFKNIAQAYVVNISGFIFRNWIATLY